MKKLKLYLIIRNMKLMRLLSDEKYLKLIFRIRLNEKLNLKNPSTFNEKMQWLKLNDRKEIYTTMADKYEVKKYVADIIGKEYIIPTLGVYDRFDDIDFSKLPNKFVIKCTHDSGGLVICRDKGKFDIALAKKKINKCLKNNYYYSGREWPYKKITPRIIAEKYINSNELNELRDYKFFCFNGEVKCFKIDYDRFIKHRANYYDRNAKLLKFGEEICPPDFNKNLIIPTNLPVMIELAEKLSCNNPFVRVDFYNVNNKIYFGEITFYPASGLGKFIPKEWDKILGEWIKLPNERSDRK